MTKPKRWPDRHPKIASTRAGAICLMCNHFYLSAFEINYEDQGSDYPMTMECQKRYWDADEDAHSTETFRQIMKTAEKCADFTKV